MRRFGLLLDHLQSVKQHNIELHGNDVTKLSNHLRNGSQGTKLLIKHPYTLKEIRNSPRLN